MVKYIPEQGDIVILNFDPQIKSIDYNARKIKFVEKADIDTVNKILGIIDSILD